MPPARGPRDAVFARVDVNRSTIEALRSLVYRSPVRVINLDQIPYRLVVDVAQNGLLLSLPRSADYRAPFTLAPNASTIGFDQQSSFAAPGAADRRQLLRRQGRQTLSGPLRHDPRFPRLCG